MATRPHARPHAHPSPHARSSVRSAEFLRYLEELIDERIARALNPNHLAVVSPSRFSQPTPLARERIAFLIQAVREAPPEGVRIEEILLRLNENFAIKLKSYSLREFVRRYAAYHPLVVRGRGGKSYVRLNTEAVVEMLATRRKVG